MTGCSSLPTVPLKDTTAIQQNTVIQSNTVVTQNGWWTARFAIEWPENTEPRWYMDVFLAQEIVSPILSNFQDRIVLWRFHRRAARDKAGHQFSFIFYASPETAKQISRAFQADKLLKEMKQAGLIIRDSYDNHEELKRPNIEDTSDHNWSSSIQKAWPYYIMGVSHMWLDLINKTEVPTAEKPSSLQDKVDFYKQISASVTTLWQDEGRHAFLHHLNEGRHAFLHHLNAIFGYAPISILEKRLTRF
jgi:hypothetical protein